MRKWSFLGALLGAASLGVAAPTSDASACGGFFAPRPNPERRPSLAYEQALISPRARPPRVKMGATTVNGKLPPEVIQRIVRQNFGRFRLCYETALQSDPAVEGKIGVKFTIEKDGSTSKVSEGTSTIKDAGMRSCITNAFQGLSFPQPEGGVVTVVYPLLFEPPIE